MKVHESIAKALADLGVTTIFGLVGDGNLFTVYSYSTQCGGTYVSAASEAGAVLMAIGYAMTSGELGVATVTHGPGVTNTVTALVQGVRSHTPIVLLAADTPGSNRDHPQNISQRDVVLPTGAGFEQLRSPDTIGIDVSTACRRALVEQRPLVLNVPADFNMHDVDPAVVPRLPPFHRAIGPDPVAMDAAVGLIASANRPIILAGRGAIGPTARASLLLLAERIGAPVATTLKAKDLFRGEPFDLGLFGTLSAPATVDTILESDCIIAFGASLNEWTTASGTYLAGRRVVHCDIEYGQIGRSAPVDVAVVGDAAVVADTVVAWLDRAEVARTGFRSDALSRRLAEGAQAHLEYPSTSETVDIRAALQAIEEALPTDRTVVFDSGRFILSALGALRAPEPRAWVTTLDFASIGLGAPTAIGAAYGRPGHPVLLVTGDGGFMLGGLAEFNSAVRHGVDLVTVVLNDGSYGAELRHLRAHGVETSLSQFEWPDFAPLAVALGGDGFTVSGTDDLGRLPDVIAERRGPLLIDFKLDPFKVAG